MAGIEPREVLRFDGNVPPNAPPYARPEMIAGALAEINRYPHGGFPALEDAIAEYAGVAREQLLLGAGADDLVLLCARAFACPGDAVDVRNEPTYPLLRISAWLAGADLGEADPALTFCCRPHNPDRRARANSRAAAARRRRGLPRVLRRDTPSSLVHSARGVPDVSRIRRERVREPRDRWARRASAARSPRACRAAASARPRPARP